MPCPNGFSANMLQKNLCPQSRQTQALPNTEAPLPVLWDQVMCFGAPHGLRGSCTGASEELGISTTLAELPNKEGL